MLSDTRVKKDGNLLVARGKQNKTKKSRWLPDHCIEIFLYSATDCKVAVTNLWPRG